MAEHCEIKVRGRLAPGWSDWFLGLTLTPLMEDRTALHGVLPDQAALHGVLERIRDLNIPLISVTCRRAPPAAPPARTSDHDDPA
jgi:hypothetical protein